MSRKAVAVDGTPKTAEAVTTSEVMTMGLIMTGTIAAIRRGEFDGKKFVSLQFTATDRFGGLRVDTIYVDEGYDVSGYKVGQDVEVPVTASVNKKTGQLSFRMHDPAVEAQRPARPPLTVAK